MLTGALEAQARIRHDGYYRVEFVNKDHIKSKKLQKLNKDHIQPKKLQKLFSNKYS
jgi:hypothetical protein